MTIPWIAYGNDTLEQQPSLQAGSKITCPKCGQRHTLETSDPPMLLFYRCRGHLWLAAVSGKNVIGRQPDASGRLDAA